MFILDLMEVIVQTQEDANVSSELKEQKLKSGSPFHSVERVLDTKNTLKFT